jgi:hypothetical protein
VSVPLERVVRRHSRKHLELEALAKILKALWANPAIEILGSVTLMQRIGYLGAGEFGLAELAMVMVPLWII